MNGSSRVKHFLSILDGLCMMEGAEWFLVGCPLWLALKASKPKLKELGFLNLLGFL